MSTLTQGLRETFAPRRIIAEIVTLAQREIILLAAMILATVVSFYFGKDFSIYSWISLAVGISTALNLILIDRGRLTNYFWGFISNATWLVMALQNHLIGDIASQTFYFVMQFVGIVAWQKQLTAEATTEVKSRKLTPAQVLLVLLGTVAIYLTVVFVSHKANGNQIWLDATLLPLGIVGQILMTYGYRSQWVAWIALNAINVVVWYNQLHAGGTAASSMLVLQIVMLVNSLYGAYVWSKNTLD